MQTPHIPVLLDEVNEIFKNFDKGDFLDCTLGYAGHSKRLLELHPNLHLIACDQDETALNFSKKYLENFKERTEFYHCNFSQILDKISTNNLRGILADIGVSSLQLDENERGFSLNSDFLDMRMNQNESLSAYELVNFYPKEKLALIFKEYGELKDAEFLADKICKQRAKKEIKSAKELYQIIGDAKLGKRKISKATLLFQALRIEVNGELDALNHFLTRLENLRLKDCILAVICFHSLEDRMVKNFFKKWSKDCICDDLALKCECGANHSLGKILSKKPIVPNESEKKKNSRSSCAKMRVFYFQNQG